MQISGWLMLEDDTAGGPGRVRLSPGWLRIDDGHVAEVVAGELPAEQDRGDLGGPSFVVMPGLVDAHVHLPQFGIIGAHGLGLLDWLERVTFPAELAWADPSAARSKGESAIRRMLACGTTGFAAYATVHHGGARAALAAAEQAGVRAQIGQVMMDRGAPEALCRPADQLIEETDALLRAYPPGARVGAAVTPRFAPACTAELLAGAGQLAQQHGALVQTHLAETTPECAVVAELFDAESYAGVYRDAGLLTERAVLGHGIYLDDAEHRLLVEAGSTIAHCPTANRFLMSGRFHRARAVDAGVRVALGSDIGAGYEVSMVRVARAMVQTAADLDPDQIPSAAEAWHAVTAGNARALGWPDGGRIAPGCPADLVVVEPTMDLDGSPGERLLSAMLFGWDDRWVSQTLLRGRVAWAGEGRSGPD